MTTLRHRQLTSKDNNNSNQVASRFVQKNQLNGQRRARLRKHFLAELTNIYAGSKQFYTPESVVICAFHETLSIPQYFFYTSACFFGLTVRAKAVGSIPLQLLLLYRFRHHPPFAITPHYKELHLNFFGSSLGELFQKLRSSKPFHALALLFVALAIFGLLPQVSLA